MKLLSVIAVGTFSLLAACNGPATPTLGATAPSAAPAPAPDLRAKLWPSAWVGSEIGGVLLIAGSTVSLAFDATGKVSGSATCNRFSGQARIEGEKLTFGPMAVTRMACAGEGLNAQEAAFLKALEGAERAVIAADGSLEVYGANPAALMRFKPAMQ